MLLDDRLNVRGRLRSLNEGESFFGRTRNYKIACIDSMQHEPPEFVFFVLLNFGRKRGFMGVNQL
jgi:hypothetical protein